jgi:hypothetical protein
VCIAASCYVPEARAGAGLKKTSLTCCSGTSPDPSGFVVMSSRRLLSPDLVGWHMAGQGSVRWRADGVPEAGVLEIEGGPGLLWYAGEAFGDFVLEVAWRILRRDDNSGVFLRCPPLGTDPQPAIEQGYEVQIDDRGFDPQAQRENSPLHLTGAIYGLVPATRHLSRPIGAWNVFEIVAHGPSIAVALNGERVARLAQGTRRSHGHIGLQAHHVGGRVQFRDLHVRLP